MNSSVDRPTMAIKCKLHTQKRQLRQKDKAARFISTRHFVVLCIKFEALFIMHECLFCFPLPIDAHRFDIEEILICLQCNFSSWSIPV